MTEQELNLNRLLYKWAESSLEEKSQEQISEFLQKISEMAIEIREKTIKNIKESEVRFKLWSENSKRLLEAWHNEPLTPTGLWCNDIPAWSKEAKMSYKQLLEQNIIGPNAVYSTTRKIMRKIRKA